MSNTNVLYDFYNIDKVPVNQLVPYYLMSSYLYYECDLNVVDDHEFDKLCSRLLNEYDTITHMHVKLFTREDLIASTGYALTYPTIVKHSALMWYRDSLIYRFR